MVLTLILKFLMMQQRKTKVFVLFLILNCWYICSWAQNSKKDEALILGHQTEKNYNEHYKAKLLKPSNPLFYPFSFALFFYQKVISPQFGGNCLYYPSCSNFSKQCIGEYGIFKGLLLSADRISRCNRLATLDFPLLAPKTAEGKIIDLPNYYEFRKKGNP